MLRRHIAIAHRDARGRTTITRVAMTSSRDFTDDVGVAWTVCEITSPSLEGALARVLEHDRRRGGWLVFESDEGEKRRLVAYPADWSTISDFELTRWCMRAVPVPPAPARRAQD